MASAFFSRGVQSVISSSEPFALPGVSSQKLLVEATGVFSHWLGIGIGDPYDPEPETTKEPLAHPAMLTHVTVVPSEGD
ncbi:hypothetical protein [Endozoicomonas sp. ALE010]|uniref:hypothetical protein n=1 Tax=Endozoicomonas sp. ALE010 TaxID=3403081 RepID=UPI003BB5AF4B